MPVRAPQIISTTVSAGPDNGANDCNATKFPNVRRHHTTAEACSNILAFASMQTHTEIFISGHGQAGMLDTGVGQVYSYFDIDNMVGWFSRDVWVPAFGTLYDAKFMVLTIYSCETGAEEEGATLLSDIADLTDRAVRARTGLTYCGSAGVSFEPNSEWQMAYPGKGPPPTIHLPAPPQQQFAHTGIGMLQIGIDNFVFPDAITAISFTRYGINAKTFTLKDRLARELATRIFGGGQFLIAGRPLAFLTAEMNLVHLVGGNEVSSSFKLYNSRLWVSADEKLGFYNRIGPSLWEIA